MQHEQEHKALKAEIDLHTKKIASITENADNIAAYESHLERRKSAYQHFVSLGNWINSELNNLSQKKKLVVHEDDPSCPLCEQNLSASRRRFLKLNLEKQEAF